MQRELPAGCELRPFATVGRSLVATQHFPPGSVVVKDEPIMAWDPNLELPAFVESQVTPGIVPAAQSDDAEATAGANSPSSTARPSPAVIPIPRILGAAAAAFVKAVGQGGEQGAAVFEVVIDMHVPDLPIGESSLALYLFAQRYANFIVGAAAADDDELLKMNGEYTDSVVVRLFAAASNWRPADGSKKQGIPKHHQQQAGQNIAARQKLVDKISQDLIHAMMAAKVNSHRQANGNWCLFPNGSKLAHSCSPNIMYISERQSFIAVRHIQPGECLSFSYGGGRTILQSTRLRQQGLQSSHLFICRCHRCEGYDFSRQLPCPKCAEHSVNAEGEDANEVDDAPDRGYLLRRGSPLLFLDNDVFPAKLWKCLKCGTEYSDAELDAVLKKEAKLEVAVAALTNGCYQYKAMKAMCCAVVAQLGRRHWTYAALCHHFALYFRQMTRSGCTAARHLVFSWGLKYLRTLQHLGLILPKEPMPHMLCAADIIMLAQVCGVVTRYQKTLSLLCHVALPLILALYDANDERVRHVAVLANRCEETLSPVATSSGSDSQVVSPVSNAGGEKFQSQIPSDLVSALAKVTEEHKAESESALFSLWDRFVVLMVLKQQVGQNSGASQERGDGTGGSPTGTLSMAGDEMSSARPSMDSLDSFSGGSEF